jgi:hypothetical protein
MWRWLKISLLVICALVALVAGWVHWRSYRVSSVGHSYGEKSWVGVYCARGRMVVGVGREKIDSAIKHDFYERPVKANQADVEFNETFHGGQRWGFGYYQSNLPTVGYVLAPIGVIWALSSLPIVVAIFKRMRKRVRRSANLCVNCGYDLRDISGRCPECGSEAAGQAPGHRPPVRSTLV